MSPQRRRGNAVWVMQEASRYSLPEEEIRRRRTQFNSETKKYEVKKKTYTRRLQLVLNNSSNRYDNEWVGDNALSNSTKHIRFWFQNVNGLICKNDIQEFQYNIAKMADSGTNFFAFTETKINSNKPGVNSKIVDGLKQIIPNGHFRLANSPDYPRRSMYQPGGIASGFDASLKMRYLREGFDKYGRWVWQEFGQHHMVTRVYTIYRVNAGSENSCGTSTAWYQQNCLYEADGMRVDPRKQVLIDLCNEIRPCIERGHNILLGGDFNERIYSPEAMSSQFESVGLYNVFEHRFQNSNLPRTHARGSQAIDHVWCTQHILDNISYAGFSPFGHIWDSDHRGLFVDIKASILFQNDEISLVYSDFRRLKSTIPKRTKKYLDALHTNWKYHNINQKFNDLSATKYSDDPELFEKKINCLDKQITEIMVGAERRCTKVSSHHIDDWCPETMEALELRRHKKTLLTKASKITLDTNLVNAIETFRDASVQYKEANNKYLELKKQSKQKRKDFQMELAKEVAASKGTEAAKEINTLIHIEKQRNQALRLNSTLKPRSSGGPTSILIPAISEYQRPYQRDFDHMKIDTIWQRIEFDNGEDVINWQRVTDQKIVEAMLLKWQQCHFTQANETPFASEYWHRELQDPEVQEQILDGTYDIPAHLPAEAKEILKNMKRPDNIENNLSEASYTDFFDFIKKIKEKRSSSPSGRHYGHYKVIMVSAPQYLQILHGILDLAVRHCIVLKRWQTTVTSLIEKKQGTPFIHKFRAIHIIEGDLQFVARFYYAKQMMQHAEKNNLITDEQYGGRKGRMAQSAVLNKIAYYNISHQTLTSCAFMDNDARAC